MTITTKERLACETEHESTKYSSLDEKLQARAKSRANKVAGQSRPTPDDYPILPTAEQYREGMNRLSAATSCPVLSLEREPTIDDYLSDDLRAAKKRKSVAEFLKAQHRENLLKRLPQFENDTYHAIGELQRDVENLSFQLMITNWALAAAVIIGALLWVF